jgi:hypothetical protein
MRRLAVLVPALTASVLALGVAPAARALAGVPKLSEDEAAFCADELDVVLRRASLFEGEGLSAAEVARRNEAQLQLLDECRDRHRAKLRSAREQNQDQEEVRRRVGPGATEKEREQALKEIRRERLASKPSSQLTREERAELAAGVKEEMAATHATLDRAHARDPGFMRIVHSALSCYHGDRKEELETQISSEEALLKLGNGDRQQLYALRSDLRRTDEVLARTREASAGRTLERCSTQTVALVAHCVGVRLEGKPAEAMCEPEEIQQYVRLAQ